MVLILMFTIVGNQTKAIETAEGIKTLGKNAEILKFDI